jgi:RNA polymerase sigma factor (sigma-70 family)
MERPPPKYTLLDESGAPLSPHLEDALTTLVPRLLRQFPALHDEPLLICTLENAGRRIANHERRKGPIEKLHGFAWVALQNAARSQLRQGRGRLAQKLLESDQAGVSLDAVHTRTGTADQIERAILLREVLARLTPDERRICMWKKAGFTSEEIAEYRGWTAAAVHTLLSRARQKIRSLLGVDLGDARRRQPGRRPKTAPDAPVTRDGDDLENPDGE